MIAKEIEKIVSESGWIHMRELVGCSGKEILELEQFFDKNYHLPAEYKEFLQLAGHKFSDVFTGTNASYNDVLDMLVAPSFKSEMLVEFFGVEDSDFDLAKVPDIPDDMFIVSEHQGYGIVFFRLTEGNDPPVYSWLSDEVNFEQSFDSFSLYITNQLQNFIEVYGGTLPKEKSLNYSETNRFYYLEIKIITFEIIDLLEQYIKKYPLHSTQLLNVQNDYLRFSRNFIILINSSIDKNPRITFNSNLDEIFPDISNIDELIAKRNKLKSMIENFLLLHKE